MTTYYAITLGPILKTLSLAKKTRELWSASYLFSYLMKELLRELNLSEEQLVLPYGGTLMVDGTSRDLLNDKDLQAGIFPDRAVFTMPEGKDLTDVETVRDTVLGWLSEQLVTHLKHLGDNNDLLTEAKNFFQAWFQVYAVAETFEDTEAKQAVVKALFARLDVLELQAGHFPLETRNYIQRFLSISTFQSEYQASFLKADAGLAANRFESIMEIAAKGLLASEAGQETLDTLQKFEDDEDWVSTLKASNSRDFRTHHKYVAVVQVDGDNFGDFIGQLENAEYQEFTQRLAAFSLLARQAIADYGGQPVYLGGDDALFFAPLRTESAHLFDLLHNLDGLFKEQFEPLKATDRPIPTLSAGVSISYYKHPLSEALDASRDLLFGDAKHFQMTNGQKKNAIGIRVQKHSGQQFGLVLSKSNLDPCNDKHKKEGDNTKSEGEEYTTVYKQILNMLNKHLDDEVFLNSVIQSVGQHQTLLAEIADRPKRVEAFLKNQFNEDLHKKPPYSDFLTALEGLIRSVYAEYPAVAAPDALYGCLRLVKFFNREDHA